MNSRKSMTGWVCLAVLASCAAGLARAEAPAPRLLTEDDAARILKGLHSDYDKYVESLRVVTTQKAKASPEALYSALVRTGGVEPRLMEDAPRSGKGIRNDIILFPAALDPARSPGWRELLLDHEYFHARHLARGWKVPVVDFGDAEVNHAYYEATAWSYTVHQARLGIYDQLSAADLREARATYKRHYQAIRGTIMKLQPSAWAHYRRFLVDPDGKHPSGARLAPVNP